MSKVKKYKQLPQAKETYGNVIKTLLPIGKKKKIKKGELPAVTYQVEKLKISRKNLNEYRKICGFMDVFHVPATYFSVLSQSLQMNMMATEAFPFAMLGLVHVENSVTQYRPIDQSEIVSLSVKLDNLRDHDKGQQFDFVTEVKVADELVWEGVSTYLARGKSKKGGAKKQPTPKLESDNAVIHTQIKVPEDIGRRYASISGDYNLIHIHPVTAKALGFPKAIAHGMWSKATSLAKIKNLPDAFTAQVSFKLPIFLPSKVELIVNEGPQGEGSFDLGLYSAKDSKPHLAGTVTKL